MTPIPTPRSLALLNGRGRLAEAIAAFDWRRNGRAESAGMNLDYSPLLDDAGEPAGVIAVVIETTSKVHAEQQLKRERENFTLLFEEAPSFMAMLRGPRHEIAMANPGCMQLIGHRPVLGRQIVEALPDAAAQRRAG